MADEQPHVRITNLMMYEKLMDINENQIHMMAELKHLSALPERVRAIEAKQERQDWIIKGAIAAFLASIAATITLIFKQIFGA
jgi:hypothetical protein